MEPYGLRWVDGVGGGETISGVWSSSLKTRSEAAMAACRMLNLSESSWMGRKKRWAYWMKAIRTPTVTEREDAGRAGRCRGCCSDGDAAAPDDEGDGEGGEELDDGVVEGVGEDGVGPGVLVFDVDGGEVVEGTALAVEELHDAHAGDVLLGEGVDAGGGGALAAVADADEPAEDAGGDDDERG